MHSSNIFYRKYRKLDSIFICIGVAMKKKTSIWYSQGKDLKVWDNGWSHFGVVKE